MSKEVFKYKGYVGSIEVSVEDNILFGEILFVNDLVTYAAETIEGLKTEFHAAVDEYLEDCAAEGLEPNKPFTGTLQIRFRPELHKRAALKAYTEGVSLNAYVNQCLETCLESDPKIQRHEVVHTINTVSTKRDIEFPQAEGEEEMSFDFHSNVFPLRSHH